MWVFPARTSCIVYSSFGVPRWMLMFGLEMLASRTTTSLPKFAKAVPRLMAATVFPTPPFAEPIATNLVMLHPWLSSQHGQNNPLFSCSTLLYCRCLSPLSHSQDLLSL